MGAETESNTRNHYLPLFMASTIELCALNRLARVRGFRLLTSGRAERPGWLTMICPNLHKITVAWTADILRAGTRSPCAYCQLRGEPVASRLAAVDAQMLDEPSRTSSPRESSRISDAAKAAERKTFQKTAELCIGLGLVVPKEAVRQKVARLWTCSRSGHESWAALSSMRRRVLKHTHACNLCVLEDYQRDTQAEWLAPTLTSEYRLMSMGKWRCNRCSSLFMGSCSNDAQCYSCPPL